MWACIWPVGASGMGQALAESRGYCRNSEARSARSVPGLARSERPAQDVSLHFQLGQLSPLWALFSQWSGCKLLMSSLPPRARGSS
jgi:hypothetical protein